MHTCLHLCILHIYVYVYIYICHIHILTHSRTHILRMHSSCVVTGKLVLYTYIRFIFVVLYTFYIRSFIYVNYIYEYSSFINVYKYVQNRSKGPCIRSKEPSMHTKDSKALTLKRIHEWVHTSTQTNQMKRTRKSPLL